jgi:hypothetical protein
LAQLRQPALDPDEGFLRTAAHAVEDRVADPHEPAVHGRREDLRCDTFALGEQSQQDVLRADVVVPEFHCLPQRQLEHFLRPRREGHVSLRR